MSRASAWLLVGAVGPALACSSESTNAGGSGGSATGGVQSGGTSSGGVPTGGGGTSGAGFGGTGGAAGGAAGGGTGGTPACDGNAGFGGISEVAELDLGAPIGEQFARLTPNELVVYFTRFQGQGSPDIFSASRKTAADTDLFGKPVEVEVNSGVTDSAASVTSSNTVLYFSSDRSGVFKIYVATRPTEAVAYTLKSTPVIDGGPAMSFLNPYVLPDGSAMYLVGGTGGATYDLYRADNSGGVFGAPAKLAGPINDPDSIDGAPIVTADDKKLFFTSRRAGDSSFEIYVSERNAPAQAFGPANLVSELNSSSDDIPSWISPDGCRMYFFRIDASNVSRIYRARRGS